MTKSPSHKYTDDFLKKSAPFVPLVLHYKKVKIVQTNEVPHCTYIGSSSRVKIRNSVILEFRIIITAGYDFSTIVHILLCGALPYFYPTTVLPFAGTCSDSDNNNELCCHWHQYDDAMGHVATYFSRKVSSKLGFM